MSDRFEKLVGLKFNHPEAYMLMRYASEDGRHEEWVWNSRDGVTPFIIHSRDGKHELRHTDWKGDQFKPYHVPKPGERYFADLTEGRCRRMVHEYVESQWEAGEFPLSGRYGSKEEAEQLLLRDWCADGHQPVILEWESPGSWCVLTRFMDVTLLECQRCKANETVKLPMKSQDFLVLSHRFIAQHEGCQ